MLDKQNRLTFPTDLMERSNLKGTNRVCITLINGDILFVPFGKEIPPDIKVFGIRYIEKDKRRINLPKSLVDISRKWTPYLLNGEIWATRHID